MRSEAHVFELRLPRGRASSGTLTPDRWICARAGTTASAVTLPRWAVALLGRRSSQETSRRRADSSAPLQPNGPLGNVPKQSRRLVFIDPLGMTGVWSGESYWAYLHHKGRGPTYQMNFLDKSVHRRCNVAVIAQGGLRWQPMSARRLRKSTARSVAKVSELATQTGRRGECGASQPNRARHQRGSAHRRNT